jgi:hypothetical protein
MYVAIKRSLIAMFFSFSLLLIPYMAMGNAYTLFEVQDWKTTHYDGRQRWADVTSHWATVVYGVERVLYVVEISLTEPIHYPLPWTLRLISALQQPNNM